MSRHKRKQLLVDGRIQGLLMLRTVSYWGFALLTISLMLLCWRIATGPVQFFNAHLAELWQQFAPALVASLLLLPLVVVDMVRLSNRFTGPVYRLRRGMRQLAAGETVPRLAFRGDDFWREFADEFNAVAARLGQLAGPEEAEHAGADEPAANRS